MKKLKIFMLFLFLGLMSCEPCEDQGKENIQIGIAEGIDSIVVRSGINFSVTDREGNGLLYTSGFIDTREESLNIEVCLDSIQTMFEFEIVPDAYHDIFIADSASIACLNEEEFELETRNNINTCYRSCFLECP